MDKKIIIIITVTAIIFISIAGFFAYNYINHFNDKAEQQMPSGDDQQENLPKENISGNNDSQKADPPIDVKTEKPKGSFTICVDQCGDRICQSESIDCSNNNLNCICPENYSECPQDCPNIP